MRRSQSSRTRWSAPARLSLVVGILAVAASVTTYTSGLPVWQKLTRGTPAASSSSGAIKANRTVPKVSPPPTAPTFSSTPTDAEIRRARAFGEPLVALGTTSGAENRALADAVLRYCGHGAEASDVRAFSAFLKEYPASAWRASLVANLGAIYRATQFHGRALDAWDEAWRLSKDDTSPEGRTVADLALGGALDMLSTLGSTPLLDRWLARAEGRDVSGPAAIKLQRARGARAIMRDLPERVIASGPKALEVLLAWRAHGRDRKTPAALAQYRATAAGTSIAELRAFASQVGLSLTAVEREAGAPLVVPAIVHLKFDHFSAVLEEVNGRYRVRDPALGGEVWMPRDALDEEMSGHALFIAGDALPPGWHDLSESDAAAIVGHSCPPGLPDPEEPPPCPLCDDGGGSGAGPGCPGGSCSAGVGMPAYTFHPLFASLMFFDNPIGYQPPRGPAVAADLLYNHYDYYAPQTYAFSNLGRKWKLNWIAYAEEYAHNCTGGPSCMVGVATPGGAQQFFWADAQGNYGSDWRSRAGFAVVSADPIRYERRLADGAREIYGAPDGAPPGSRRVFLSSLVDAQGQAVQLTWDSQSRLVALTDATGQVTTLGYDDPDPLKVTSITDPFGRVARFTYNGSRQLASITDVANLSATFAYDSGDFITSMTTPYGTSTFRRSTPAQYDQTIEATDPLGAVERLEFHMSVPDLPATAPSEEVPAGFESANGELNVFVTLRWKKGRTIGDLSQAVVTTLMLQSADNNFWDPPDSVNFPRTVKRPGEAREWYAYTAAWNPTLMGERGAPSRVARRLADGTVQDTQTTYNALDQVTWRRDPAGRETTFTYADNGIDLLEVRNTSGGRNDLIARYAEYTAQHLPQSVTDAAAQSSTFTYNEAGQVLTATNAKQERTTLAYDTAGLLQSVTGPVSGATSSYTYDAYGRVRTTTNADGWTVTRDYDALDRPTTRMTPSATSWTSPTRSPPYSRRTPSIWGRRTLTTGADVTNLGFTGHQWEASGRLSRAMYRVYDSDLGRWLGEDPKGLLAGLNLYEYAHASPGRFVDPLGLDIKEMVRAIWNVGPLDAWTASTLADAALRGAEATGLDGLHNGPADAYRHCLWSCEMTKALRIQQAKLVADEHEYAGQRSGQNPAERKMDEANNYAGRHCRIPNGKGKMPTCEEACMGLLRSGRLYGLGGQQMRAPELPK
jgi:RHS repeat-associated protein